MIRTKLPLAFAALIIFSLLNWHCTKVDITRIGSDLIPAVDNVNTFELILPVVSNNADSVAKDCATIFPTDDHVLGYIGNDLLFGTTTATIYSELKPPVFPFSLSGTAAGRTLDSVVLVLKYRRSFGDSSAQQRIEVREINVVTNPQKGFQPDSSTCSAYLAKSTVLGSATYTPKNLSDTIQLRIKLSNTFFQSFIAQDSSNSLNAFRSDSLFRNSFKGFAIIPDKTGNCLSYFNLADTNTKLAIYYKYKRTGLSDTSDVSNFRLNTAANSANTIVRDHANSELLKYNIKVHPPAGDDFIYIQTTPGTYADITIPALTGLSNRIIARAELIMDQIPQLPGDPFVAPNLLYLDLRFTDSIYRPIPCDFVAPGGQPDILTFGGFKKTVKDALSGKDIARYTFNISRYVQKIVTNKRLNSALRLRAPDYIRNSSLIIDDCNQGLPALYYPYNILAYGRVKLGGGSNANYKMKLRIIYSNL